ncbi:MAG: DUF6691 family protein [Gammaproteobacteria bacterium]
MRALSFLLLGALFAVGLGISGMTQPAKVLGFLDVFGAWDPALMFVMGGAVTVTFAGYRWVLKRPMPLLAAKFEIPSRRDIDLPLIGGAALFGLGWGTAGFCPGPAITALASGSLDVLVFVGAMFAGFLLKDVALGGSASSGVKSPA